MRERIELITGSPQTQWAEHWTNGGTGITKTSGLDTEEITASVAAFGDPSIFMLGSELHSNQEAVDLSKFWQFHRNRLKRP
jgi:hypothetical protein